MYPDRLFRDKAKEGDNMNLFQNWASVMVIKRGQCASGGCYYLSSLLYFFVLASLAMSCLADEGKATIYKDDQSIPLLESSLPIPMFPCSNKKQRIAVSCMLGKKRIDSEFSSSMAFGKGKSSTYRLQPRVLFPSLKIDYTNLTVEIFCTFESRRYIYEKCQTGPVRAGVLCGLDFAGIIDEVGAKMGISSMSLSSTTYYKKSSKAEKLRYARLCVIDSSDDVLFLGEWGRPNFRVRVSAAGGTQLDFETHVPNTATTITMTNHLDDTIFGR